MDSSDKMENSVLGCRFSEKVEHLPIKKRRFLFETPSPPPITASSDETVSVAACPHSSSQEVVPKPEASDLPVVPLTDADLHQSGNIDSKVDEEKVVKDGKKTSEDQDICGTSLVEVKAACSNGLGDGDLCEGSGIVSNDTKSLEATGTIELKANSVKLETLSAMETDFNISTVPSKLDCSSQHVPLESECSKMNQVTSKTQNSADLDDRLNWDLNTVMPAWEESLECDQTINTADVACSNITYSEGKNSNSEGCEKGNENMGNETLPLELKSLTPKMEKSELEECKPVCNGISKLLSHVAIPVTVPSTLTLEHATCDISAKHLNVNCKGTDNLSYPIATDTGFSLDYSIPLVFDHSINMCASEENVVSSKIVGSGNHVNHAITTVHTTENENLNLSLVTAASIDNGVRQSGNSFDEDDKSKVKRVITSNNVVSSELVGSGNYANHAITTLQTTENEKVSLSLVTATSLGNGVCQSGSTFDEDDKSKVKRVISSNGITMENLSGEGTEISQDGHKRNFKESFLVMQSSVLTEVKEQPAAVSSMHEVVCSDAEMPIKSRKSPVTETIYRHESHTKSPNNLVSYNKEVSDFPSDIQVGSEVDNVDEEYSYGYDSQFEDGEYRESSIQTWDEYEEDDKEIEHGTDLGAFNAHKNSSQKGVDEISSLLLPEKLDSSDRVSGSEPNGTENGLTTEVSMKDASQSDQWKMNVSGSDILPENHSSSSNITKIRDFRSIKFSSRIGRYGPQTEDLETKAEGSRFYRREPRDAFLNKGRFRMQGCSSSNADDSAFRSVRQGKYTSCIPAHGAFSGPSSLTNEPNVDPSITRQPFRTRLLANREEDEFRARLGLRPSDETCQNRLVNVGRGRSLRYGSRHNGGGPRGRYYGRTTNDEYDEPSMEYSHSIPVRRRYFSPTHHRSGSTSPPSSQTRTLINVSFKHRSRSPILRSDTRIRRVNLEPRNNNSSPSSRWVNYKQRLSAFDRRSSPPPINERVSFFDSSRKTKQSENYRSGPFGQFSEIRGGGRDGPGPRYDGDVTDRGGGFVKRYDMGRPVKHIQYDDEDVYGPEYDSRGGNPKPYSNETDSRFRDIPRRPREDKENW